jgi:membrane protease YdiL (CAAX protease family)
MIPNVPIVQIFLAIISFIFILKFGKEWRFFEKIKNLKKVLFLTLFLIILFAINNYLIINYDTTVPWKTKYLENPILPILISYVLGSTSEEIIYRGFIQNYINNKIGTKKNRIISNGNWIATSIMTLIHIGFFAYFDLTFAITSIILVFIFSLVSGYIMDKTKNITIPIIIHILVNFTHYFVCLGVLKNYT